MTEPTRKLENELSDLRPRPLSEELIDRIEASLLKNRSGDRLLKFSMTFGTLAASVIVTLLWIEPRDPASTFTPASTASHTAKPGDPPQIFAWADRHLQLNDRRETP